MLDSDWLSQECSTAHLESHCLEPDFDRSGWLVKELTADWIVQGLDIQSYCMGKGTVVSDKC